MRSNGFKFKIIMIGKSIVWELSLPVFDTCVDDHVCKKIRMPHFIISCEQSSVHYCLTKISIRANPSISRVFSLFIVPSPFFCTLPVQGRINRAESVLIGLKPY